MMYTMEGEKKSMTNEEYKKLSINEFTKAAGRYERDHAGIYEVLKKSRIKSGKFEIRKGMRMHCVVRKIVEK